MCPPFQLNLCPVHWLDMLVAYFSNVHLYLCEEMDDQTKYQPPNTKKNTEAFLHFVTWVFFSG
jgi:hypothetical protein